MFLMPWFILFLPLPLIVYFFFSKKQAIQELHFPALDRLKRVFPLCSKAESFPYLLFGVWALIILALMQPVKTDARRLIKKEGYDLLLAVDISGSMQALDFSTSKKQVNRLDVTKEVVGDFIKRREGDRIGLITFGKNAYLHVPLTHDIEAVSKALSDTTFGMAGNGTAIGDAIGLAVRTLRARPEGSRVLVLLTDGEDNSSSISPIEAAKLANLYGIKIYTVGVGKKGAVAFPSQFGGYMMGESPMDTELLKKIADMTDGQSFLADEKIALEMIYKKIDSMEKTENEENLLLLQEPLYAYFLSGAALLFLMGFIGRQNRAFY